MTSRSDVVRLADQMRLARGLACLSQSELSQLAGLPRGAVWFVEERGVVPSADRLCALAEVLGVSVAWLVRGTGPHPVLAQVAKAVGAARRRRRAEEVH